MLQRSGRLLRPWGEGDVEMLEAAYRDEAIRVWQARNVESPREAHQLIGEWNGYGIVNLAAR